MTWFQIAAMAAASSRRAARITAPPRRRAWRSPPPYRGAGAATTSTRASSISGGQRRAQPLRLGREQPQAHQPRAKVGQSRRRVRRSFPLDQRGEEAAERAACRPPAPPCASLRSPRASAQGTPAPSGDAASAASRSSQRQIQVVARVAPAKWSRSNQRGCAGALPSGVDGDDFQVVGAKRQKAVVRAHSPRAARRPAAAGPARAPPASAPSRQMFGRDRDVIECQHVRVVPRAVCVATPPCACRRNGFGSHPCRTSRPHVAPPPSPPEPRPSPRRWARVPSSRPRPTCWPRSGRREAM